MKHSIISALLVLVLSLIFVACGGDSEEAENSGGIFGYVTDAVTGEPVPNAYVVLENVIIEQRCVTGSDGYFEFVNLPNSRSDDDYHPYGIEVDKQGYETFRSGSWNPVHGYRNIEVKEEMIRFDVLLEPEK